MNNKFNNMYKKLPSTGKFLKDFNVKQPHNNFYKYKEDESSSHSSNNEDEKKQSLLFNTNNIEITNVDVELLLLKYNIHYKIKNINLFKRAFIHKSYTTIKKDIPPPIGCIPLKTKSNERLEFLGDGILELSAKHYLYRRFPDEDEGFMTEKKIAIVNNEAIGQFSKEIGLHKWFVISASAELKQSRNNLKLLGALFESFIGALFLDANSQNLSGFDIAQSFIVSVFETHVDWIHILQNDENYKNNLQMKLQKEFKIIPTYIEISPKLNNQYQMGIFLYIGKLNEQLPPHHLALDISNFKLRGDDKKINISTLHDYLARNDGVAFICLGIGSHQLKKRAEQMACKNALDCIDFI